MKTDAQRDFQKQPDSCLVLALTCVQCWGPSENLISVHFEAEKHYLTEMPCRYLENVPLVVGFQGLGQPNGSRAVTSRIRWTKQTVWWNKSPLSGPGMPSCHHSHHFSHCSERRAGIIQGTLASLDYCPTGGKRNIQLFVWATKRWTTKRCSCLLTSICWLEGEEDPIPHIAASCQLQEFPTLQLDPELNFLWTFLCYISVSWASTSWSSWGEKRMKSSISF